ncbi:phytanoyl-CoA dioxygenase family protein [Candidatus Uabimicrobium amorphum]|uniref:Non-ribosomal peptide synthase n=1 Tax=Uabimicrobium amorphum TaxID=2596890 RepID=A0A5S9F0J1_UABAM|nr:phytanoyl-CoA dioxygenase family protein [Candidatus Uabimicrobium amorphum]BBM81665.1 non-ribosomal peptide synthase [Candidatus Uabimicrobium amorphum]
MSLSNTELDFFDENGYVGPFTLFSEKDAFKYIKVINSEKFTKKYPYLDIDSPYKEPRLRCFNTHLYDPSIYDLASSPIILDKIEQLMGPNFLLWRTIFIIKPPNSGSVAWHKDIYGENDNMGNFSCWVALNDATEENGCLEFVKGSHKETITQKEMYRDEEYLKKTVLSPYLLPPPGMDARRIVKQPLKTGEFVIFDQRTLHGSAANISSGDRKGLVIRYVPIDLAKELKSPCMLMRGSSGKQRFLSPPSKNWLLKTMRKYRCRRMPR